MTCAGTGCIVMLPIIVDCIAMVSAVIATYTYGLDGNCSYSYALCSDGLVWLWCRACLRTDRSMGYGTYRYGLYSYEPCRYGLDSHAKYNHCLCTLSTVIAYVVMAYVVVAYMIMFI